VRPDPRRENVCVLLFTGRTPFLSLNQQCQRTDGTVLSETVPLFYHPYSSGTGTGRVAEMLDPHISSMDPPPPGSALGGDRTFPVAAARVWNTLPVEVTCSTSIPAFKRHLRRHYCPYGASTTAPEEWNTFSPLRCSNVLSFFFL